MAVVEYSQALVDLERVKQHAGITGTASDAELVRLANETSARIRSYCGRNFISATYTHDGTTMPRLEAESGSRLWVAHPPITSVTSLKTYSDGTALTESTDGYMTGDFVVHNGTGMIELINGAGFPYPGLKTVELTYVGGFLTTGTAAQLLMYGLEERAGDLVLACAQQVAWAFAHKDRVREGVASVSSGGTTVSYMTDPWLPEVAEVLDRYRRILPS